MAVLSDAQIRAACMECDLPALAEPMIEPFSESVSGNGIISYGVTSYGYDCRLANEFMVFRGTPDVLIDPKSGISEDCFVNRIGDYCIIPPNSFALGRSVEYLRIPRNMVAICIGKSTYARCGIIVNVTPLEPEWEGHVTIEISNTTPLPVKVYANEGIMQVMFHIGDDVCEVSYTDKKGKYQGQTGITLPIVQ